jgi:hypothetical protein
VWAVLDPDQRLAAGACVALFLTMFLPWFSQTETVVVGSAAKSTLASAQSTLSAFQAFSFVEAAVLLVSASVLAMLWARAAGQPFRLPGGDGLIVMAAGLWTALLIVYRMLDTPGPHGTHSVTSSIGVEWGIFLALIAAIVLAAAGSRMRALREPSPPLLRPRGSSPESASETGESWTASGAETTSTAPTSISAARERDRAAEHAPARLDTEAPLLAGGRPRYPPAPTTPPTAALPAPLAAPSSVRAVRIRSHWS